jgi:hypothetical protein
MSGKDGSDAVDRSKRRVSVITSRSFPPKR